MSRYHDVFAPGSMLALSHACGDKLPADVVTQAVDLCAQSDITIVSRARDEIGTTTEQRPRAPPEVVDAGAVDRWSYSGLPTRSRRAPTAIVLTNAAVAVLWGSAPPRSASVRPSGC